MLVNKATLLLLASLSTTAGQNVCSDIQTMPMPGEMNTITFVGYQPTVTRLVGRNMVRTQTCSCVCHQIVTVTNHASPIQYVHEPFAVQGNKVIVTNFGSVPSVGELTTTSIEIIAGEATCDTGSTSTSAPTSAPLTSAAFTLGAVSFSLLSGNAFGAVASMMFGLFMSVSADDASCSPVEVEIYQDYADLINYEAKSGQHEVCGPETFYYKHHPLAHGGYEGCVSEKYLYPCAQDNEGARTASLYAKYPYNWDLATKTCVETGYTYQNRTFWIVSGDPLDKYELVKRTGLNPVVTFPLLAGPYPSYTNGPGERTTDDTLSAKSKAYDFLVYIDAFKEENRDDWYVSFTEGAESGMVITWGAQALDIARTTCNRAIYVFNEVPSYSYSTTDAAAFANRYSSSFYSGPECECTADNSCTNPTVSITIVGWFPGTPVPSRTGGDGIEYVATSSSPLSPWFESIVFPENP